MDVHPDMLAIRNEYEAAHTPSAVIHFVFDVLAANTLELDDAYRRVSFAACTALERAAPRLGAPELLRRCMKNSGQWRPYKNARACAEALGEESGEWTMAACFHNAVRGIHLGIVRLDEEVFTDEPSTGVELARAIGGAQNAFANAVDAAAHLGAWDAWALVFRASVASCEPPTSTFVAPGVSQEASDELARSMFAVASLVREALALEWPLGPPTKRLAELGFGRP